MLIDYKSKEYSIRKLGESDIAALVMAGPSLEGLVKTSMLNFGEDGDYYAHIVDECANIPDRYEIQFMCKNWLRIYDDDGYLTEYNAPYIYVYTCGMRGCVIQLIKKIPDIQQSIVNYLKDLIIKKSEDSFSEIKDNKYIYIDKYGTINDEERGTVIGFFNEEDPEDILYELLKSLSSYRELISLEINYGISFFNLNLIRTLEALRKVEFN